MAINHKHLFYFWKTAREGGVVKAGEALHVTPQTISGQIRLLEESLGAELFDRQGRSLELTETGRLVLEYAEEMFSLSAELEQMVRHYPGGRPTDFRVGVSDALPKSLVYRLLQPAVSLPEPVRIVCREWRLERLLAELLEHRLDLVLADTPVPAGLERRAYSHHLGESGLSFIASRSLLPQPPLPFPSGLGHLPLLVPGEDAAVRQKLMAWLERRQLRPKVVGEFDDSALMTAFGQAGVGAFAVPSVIEDECLADASLVLLGRVPELRSGYYAISMERRLTHPCVLAITESARQKFTQVEHREKPD